MCGIIAAIAHRNVVQILLEGLKRLEYRGYDSAGMALIDAQGALQCEKQVGKVAVLEARLQDHPLMGHCGIAHTRWATHGPCLQANAHPHLSSDRIALVHNGIIENHAALRETLQATYVFASQTDSEVAAHLIHSYRTEQNTLLEAVQLAIPALEGAFAFVVIDQAQPDRMIAVRHHSPLVIGLGIGEHFLASDPMALGHVTDRFIYLEEGDITEITADKVTIWDREGQLVTRDVVRWRDSGAAVDKGHYRHYMRKEIDEQPAVMQRYLVSRLNQRSVLEHAFGLKAEAIFAQTEALHIVACGTSYHAGMVAQYWLEDLAGLPCRVEIASEFRYRRSVVQDNTLLLVISQSGETADSLAALRLAKTRRYLATLAICNVPQSSLVREADAVMMTEAGVEMGVASTKAFSSQLLVLLLLTVVLGRRYQLNEQQEAQIVTAMHQIPDLMREALALDPVIRRASRFFADKYHALFLGRGIHWPIAMEGALKLKEISYIHAESYPAGELKHGPLAMVDNTMPVVAVAPNDELLGKLKSNLEEVRARGGQLLVFADQHADFVEDDNSMIIRLPSVPDSVAPIIYTVPLQLLAYHVAVLKGTDIDQPRNLAKAVTVE